MVNRVTVATEIGLLWLKFLNAWGCFPESEIHPLAREFNVPDRAEESCLFAIEVDQVSVVLLARVGTAALLDDAFDRNPAAQIGDATLARLMGGRQARWRPGIHGDRLGQLVRVMLTWPVAAFTAGAGSAIEPVTRLAAAGRGVPARIRLEYAAWRNAYGPRPVEPVASGTGFIEDFAELLRDLAALGLSLLD